MRELTSTKKKNLPTVHDVFITMTVSLPRTLKQRFSFEATFNYLSDGKLITISVNDLPNLIKKGLITSKKQTVSPLCFEQNLQTHGFETRILPDVLQQLLLEFRNSDANTQKMIREKIRDELENLLSAHFGLTAIAFDTVYRNTSEDDNHAFKSVPLVHIDFPHHDLSNTFSAFQEQWMPRVQKKPGGNYDAKEVEFMVNVWMPLDDVVLASPLALCPKQFISPARLHEYNAVRRDNTTFKATSLTPPIDAANDPWFYQPMMRRGQCHMFSSTQGIHTAVELPAQSGSRASIEVRLGLFKAHPRHQKDSCVATLQGSSSKL